MCKRKEMDYQMAKKIILPLFMAIFLQNLRNARSHETSYDDDENNDITMTDDIFKDDSHPNASKCSNDLCVSDDDYIDRIAADMAPHFWGWILIAMHSIVFVIGLVGNFLVCLAVYRNHSMRTVTNYFIVNLALADLLVILFCLPPTVLVDLTETWFLGLELCKIIPYLQTVSVSVSVMTLTFISIDRWYAICFPLRFKSTTTRAKKAIFVIWLFAFLFDIADLVVLQVFSATHIRIKTVLYSRCATSWSPESEKTFTFIKLVFLYAGPLILMTVAYCQIVRVLWSGNIPGHNLSARICRPNEISLSGLGNPEGQLRSRRKAAKMLVAVVFMFGICHLPVHLLSILSQVLDQPSSELTVNFSLLAHWLCYANSAINPLIYNFMSGKFRKEFKRTFCCPSNGDNNRGVYNFAGTSNTAGRRSQMLTRSIHTMTNNNNVRQSMELIPLSAITTVQQIDKRN